MNEVSALATAPGSYACPEAKEDTNVDQTQSAIADGR